MMSWPLGNFDYFFTDIFEYFENKVALAFFISFGMKCGNFGKRASLETYKKNLKLELSKSIWSFEKVPTSLWVALAESDLLY